MRTAILLVTAGALLTGCVTSFKEDHYFKSVGPSPEAQNYFRLRITGRATFSSARYIAGFYDERAVDLFFDEMKSASSEDDAKIETLFQGGQIDLAAGQKIVPLAPELENGAFLMIFSTNARAVANTIGEFAESQVVADAVTNLVNRDEIRETARAVTAQKVAEERATAISSELASLVGALGSSSEKTPTLEGALRILSAIANAQGRIGGFQTIEEARGWFESRPGGGGVQP
jgi:hypothetical protein